MKRILPALLALIYAAPVFAETQAALNARVLRILQQQARISSQDVTYLAGTILNPKIYATAAELLAATPDDGTIGYAQDTDVFYFMTAASWVSIATLATLANGATITNAVNNTVTITENSETLEMDFSNNLITFDSNSAATYAFTPAVSMTGDLTCAGGAGALTFTHSDSSIVLPDNDSTALLIGSTGKLNAMTFDTTNDLEKINFLAELVPPAAVYESFAEGASKGFHIAQIDGTAFDGTIAVMNHITASAGRVFLVSALGGDGQTVPPSMAAAGLDLSGDAVDDEGYFLQVGRNALGGSGRPFIVGSDPGFKACFSVTIADVSITDDFHVGFMRPQLSVTNFDDLIDVASIGINASAATAAINLETILNADATTSTDTTDTWADTASKVLCTLVSAAGVVTYTINGSAPTVTAAFTFDDGDPVIPFLWYIHASSAAIGVVVEDISVGFQ